MSEHVHIVFDTPLRITLEPSQLGLLQTINQKLDKIMADLASLQAAVAAEDTIIDSAVTLISGLADQIKALQPTQEAIDALAADVSAKSAALAAAVATNTPAAPGV